MEDFDICRDPKLTELHEPKSNTFQYSFMKSLIKNETYDLYLE